MGFWMLCTFHYLAIHFVKYYILIVNISKNKLCYNIPIIKPQIYHPQLFNIIVTVTYDYSWMSYSVLYVAFMCKILCKIVQINLTLK